MKKKIIRVVGSLALVGLMFAMAVPSFATNDIDKAKDDKQKMEEKLKDTQSALKNLENSKNNAEAYILEIDKYITSLTDNIYKLEKDAEDKKEQIAIKEKEIEDARLGIDEQYEAMKLRIKYMYENGEISYMSMFFESKDISDFLNRAEYLSEITQYDRDMRLKLQDAKANLDMAKIALDTELDKLNALLDEAEQERKANEELIAAKEAQLSSTNTDIVSKEEAVKRQQDDIKAQEQIIKELEEIERKRKEEEERRKAENQTIPTYDGGKLIWPVPGHSRISSPFGDRKDPFTGLTTFHSGIDVSAPTGTPIVASYDGEVAWAYYSGSAGNWIGIDHGNGLYTIYMHMSKFVAKKGDIVKAGDIIGLVGSTGRSTGPHLHFSVRLNGKYVGPLDYVVAP